MIGDTNLFIGLLRGEQAAVDFLDQHPDLTMPFVAAAELEIGARLATHPEPECDRVAALLRLYPIIWPEPDDLAVFADTSVRLRRAGTPIGIHDTWTAALAIRRGLPVATNDLDLDRVDGLTLVRWR